MSNMPIRWKVKSILEAHNLTPYRFWQDTGLSSKVAYAIANNEHEVVDTGVLEKVIPYLREKTGNLDLQVGDVVEWVEDPVEALLAERMKEKLPEVERRIKEKLEEWAADEKNFEEMAEDLREKYTNEYIEENDKEPSKAWLKKLEIQIRDEIERYKEFEKVSRFPGRLEWEKRELEKRLRREIVKERKQSGDDRA
jgi:hypothetical protein